jgi:hypothetical protein
MIEVEKALEELKRLQAEAQRKIRNEEYGRKPDQLRLRTLHNESARLFEKIQRMQALYREVKELESSLSMKMMNRYPENKPYRAEYKRDLHRTKRQLLEMAMRHQPKEQPRRRYGSVLQSA